MAFVSVPKDLTKVKNKINSQILQNDKLICLGIAAAVGLPFISCQGIDCSSNAATGMCLLMLPAFLFVHV